MEKEKEFLTYPESVYAAAMTVNEICARICREKRIPGKGEIFNTRNAKMIVEEVRANGRYTYITFSPVFLSLKSTVTIRWFEDRDFVDVCPVSVCMN